MITLDTSGHTLGGLPRITTIHQHRCYCKKSANFRVTSCASVSVPAWPRKLETWSEISIWNPDLGWLNQCRTFVHNLDSAIWCKQFLKHLGAQPVALLANPKPEKKPGASECLEHLLNYKLLSTHFAACVCTTRTLYNPKWTIPLRFIHMFAIQMRLSFEQPCYPIFLQGHPKFVLFCPGLFFAKTVWLVMLKHGLDGSKAYIATTCSTTCALHWVSQTWSRESSEIPTKRCKGRDDWRSLQR